MKINRFEDIIAWQYLKGLSRSICKIFRDSKDFGFRCQICKASISDVNNVAEGFERKSDTEFRHFLNISKGLWGPKDLARIRVQLSVAPTRKHLDKAIEAFVKSGK